MKRLMLVFAAAALGLVQRAFADDPYIQSNGKQFIQLDYYQNSNTRVELEGAPVESTVTHVPVCMMIILR